MPSVMHSSFIKTSPTRRRTAVHPARRAWAWPGPPQLFKQKQEVELCENLKTRLKSCENCARRSD